MHFCPVCGNLLLIEEGGMGMRFCCPTCPYLRDIKKKYSSKVKMKAKEVDDVLGGADAWENVDRTQAKCPFCSHGMTLFQNMVIIEILIVCVFFRLLSQILLFSCKSKFDQQMSLPLTSISA